MTDKLLDTDGENRAVRGFLLAHSPGVTVGEMRDHLREYGTPFWPDWVAGASVGKTLNKAEAQAWLRHLFALETVGKVLVPDAEHMTDAQAEFIAEKARVCGGGAYDIYRELLEVSKNAA